MAGVIYEIHMKALKSNQFDYYSISKSNTKQVTGQKCCGFIILQSEFLDSF